MQIFPFPIFCNFVKKKLNWVFVFLYFFACCVIPFGPLAKLPFICWSPPWTQNCVASVTNHLDQLRFRLSRHLKMTQFCEIWSYSWQKTARNDHEMAIYELLFSCELAKVSKQFFTIAFKPPVEHTKMTVWTSGLWKINIHMAKKWPETVV